MVVYNVTVGIDKEVEQEWLNWMINHHIPRVLATGLFHENKIYKVLTGDEENISYSIQYFAESLTMVEKYLNEYAPALIQEHNEKFKNRHAAFRTLLQSVD